MTLRLCNFPGAISDPFLPCRWEGGVRNRDALRRAQRPSWATNGEGQSKGWVRQFDPYVGSFARGSEALFDSSKCSRRCLRTKARRAQSALMAEQASASDAFVRLPLVLSSSRWESSTRPWERALPSVPGEPPPLSGCRPRAWRRSEIMLTSQPRASCSGLFPRCFSRCCVSDESGTVSSFQPVFRLLERKAD